MKCQFYDLSCTVWFAGYAPLATLSDVLFVLRPFCFTFYIIILLESGGMQVFKLWMQIGQADFKAPNKNQVFWEKLFFSSTAYWMAWIQN